MINCMLKQTSNIARLNRFLPSQSRFAMMSPSLFTMQRRNFSQSGYPITLLVSVEIKEDRIDDFLEAIKEDARGSRTEEGCYRFDVLRSQENPN